MCIKYQWTDSKRPPKSPNHKRNIFAHQFMTLWEKQILFWTTGIQKENWG